MRTMLQILKEHGPVLWVLSVLCWKVLWKLVSRRTSSQKVSSWMLRNETPIFILYLIVSFGTLLVLSKIDFD